MGCTGSKRQHAHEHSPLTELQIRERIEAPTECKTLAIAGVKMRYAWVSQRGYYPDGMTIAPFRRHLWLVVLIIALTSCWCMQLWTKKTKTRMFVFRSIAE